MWFLFVLLFILFWVLLWFVSSLTTSSTWFFWFWVGVLIIFLWRIQFNIITRTRCGFSSLTLMFWTLFICAIYFDILLRYFLTKGCFRVFYLSLMIFIINLISMISVTTSILWSFSNLTSHFMQLFLFFFDI